MTQLFLRVVQMSVTASFVIGAVLLLRLLLCKAPKVYSYLLWAVVFVRLLCPVTVESDWSLVRSPAALEQRAAAVRWEGVAAEPNAAVPSADPAQAPAGQPIQTASEEGAEVQASASGEHGVLSLFTAIWAIGVAALLGHGIWSYLRLSHQLRTAVQIERDVYESDRILGPFVLGFFKPRIYLPLGLAGGEEAEVILRHERVHLHRGDFLWKPLAWMAVVIHWFNPLVWLSMYLMVQDMEMSCDEWVLQHTEGDLRGCYSRSLLAISARQSGLSLPLAFGEEHVENRIKHVLSFRRPAVWVVLAASLALVAAGVGLLTNPKEEQVPTYAEQLVEHRVSYVGDAPEVVTLLDLLPCPAGVVRGEVELQTNTAPYGMAVTYQSEGEIPADWPEMTAVLACALIDNVETVTIQLEDRTVYPFDRPTLMHTYGDLGTAADSAAAMEALLKRLGVSSDGSYVNRMAEGRTVSAFAGQEGTEGRKMEFQLPQTEQADTLELLAAMEQMNGFTFSESAASHGYLQLDFSGELPEDIFLRVISGGVWQQEYPIDSETHRIKVPVTPGQYAFFADITWTEKDQRTYYFPVTVLHGDDASGTILATGTVPQTEQGLGVRLVLTEGRYFWEEEDAASSYIYPTNFSGQYQLESYTLDDPEQILSTLPVQFDDTVNFSGRFPLGFADYNEDGAWDFALGQPISSSTMHYQLYTVRADGSLEELSVVKDELLGENHGFSPVLKYGDGVIATKQWNNAAGEYWNHTYTWDKEAGCFAAGEWQAPTGDTDPALETAQMEQTIERALEQLMSQPLTSSNPEDYIRANEAAYQTILDGGEPALEYLLGQFSSGAMRQDDLKGQLAIRACEELMDPQNSVENGTLHTFVSPR